MNFRFVFWGNHVRHMILDDKAQTRTRTMRCELDNCGFWLYFDFRIWLIL